MNTAILSERRTGNDSRTSMPTEVLEDFKSFGKRLEQRQQARAGKGLAAHPQRGNGSRDIIHQYDPFV
jgi:hypothetical protein